MSYSLIVYGLVGLAVGSFLNVAIDRLPRGASLLFPPSRCDTCNRRLAWWENVPLLSYLFLRGKCRTCGTRIPLRVFFVEMATGLLFAFMFWRYGLSLQLAIATIYTCIFLTLAVIDLEHKLLLNVIIYPAIPLAFAFSFFWPELGWWRALAGAGISLGVLGLIWVGAYLFYSRRGIEAFGLGDVYLAPLIGLVTGFPLVLIALQIAVVLGGIVALVLIGLGIKRRKEVVPFGPFLAVGALATLYYGQEMWDAYVRWLVG